jgi:acetyl-CoA decarbonylase/synthase complex subunit gamma
VVYGPVRASDIPQFMDNNLKTTPEMREVKFGFFYRLVLTPIEIMSWGRRMFWSKRALIIIAMLFLVAGLDRRGFLIDKLLRFGPRAIIMYSAAFLCGAIFTPLLLPWLPGRAFSIKGAFLGFLVALGIGWYYWGAAATLGVKINILAWLFLVPAISSFIAVTFVGASTYTSLSGVFKEMTRAVPLQIAMTIVGILLLITGQFF